jgi:hypothetical protein
MTSARDAVTGRTSLSPTLERTATPRNSSSIQVRGPLRIDRGAEAAGASRLARGEGVGERPRRQGEGGAGGEQLVVGGHPVLEHAGDQAEYCPVDTYWKLT